MFVLPLALLLSACVPVSTIGLSGPGRVSERINTCRDPYGEITLDLQPGLALRAHADFNDVIGGKGYRLRAYMESLDKSAKVNPSVRLTALRATISTDPGYALIDRVSVDYRNVYSRKEGDKTEEITFNDGTSLRELDIGAQSIMEYVIPDFFGPSTDITLPPLLIDGKRVGIAPITLYKKMSYIVVCAHG